MIPPCTRRAEQSGNHLDVRKAQGEDRRSLAASDDLRRNALSPHYDTTWLPVTLYAHETLNCQGHVM